MIKTEQTFCSCWLYFEVILFVFSFSFLSSDSLLWIMTTCAYNPFSVAILFKPFLTSDGMFWGSFGLFLHWLFKNWKQFTTPKYESSITSYIDIQNGWFVLETFQCLNSLFLEIPKSYSLIILLKTCPSFYHCFRLLLYLHRNHD